MRQEVCKDWDAFKRSISRYASKPLASRRAFVFRGHGSSDWELQSTLDRHFPNLSVPQRKATLKWLLKDFAEEVSGFAGASHLVTDRLELIARHHGLPTTVLDWSHSPWVAAFFAFENDRLVSDGFASVYVFDCRELARTTLSDADLITEPDRLIDNVRAIQQRGVFLRLPVGETGEEVLAPGLARYLIPQRDRRLALCELDEMTVNRRNLFRDRDAAASTVLLRHQLG